MYQAIETGRGDYAVVCQGRVVETGLDGFEAIAVASAMETDRGNTDLRPACAVCGTRAYMERDDYYCSRECHLLDDPTTAPSA